MSQEDSELELWADDANPESDPSDEADVALDKLMAEREAAERRAAGGEDPDPEPDEVDDETSEDEPEAEASSEDESTEEQATAPNTAIPAPVAATDPKKYWNDRYNQLVGAILNKELEDEQVKFEYEGNAATKRILEMQAHNAASNIVRDEMHTEAAKSNRDQQAEGYLDKKFGGAWRELNQSAEFGKWVENLPAYKRRVIEDNWSGFTDVVSLADVLEQYLGEENTGGDVSESGRAERSNGSERATTKRRPRLTPGPGTKRATRSKTVSGLEAAEAAGDPEEILVEILKSTPDSPLHGVWE